MSNCDICGKEHSNSKIHEIITVNEVSEQVFEHGGNAKRVKICEGLQQHTYVVCPACEKRGERNTYLSLLFSGIVGILFFIFTYSFFDSLDLGFFVKLVAAGSVAVITLLPAMFLLFKGIQVRLFEKAKRDHIERGDQKKGKRIISLPKDHFEQQLRSGNILLE